MARFPFAFGHARYLMTRRSRIFEFQKDLAPNDAGLLTRHSGLRRIFLPKKVGAPPM
jgi:hypothetical protein